ncbi:MAG: hypothetical protein WD712_02340 [Candidatus Spechtbacterales bacterium]
MTEEQILLSEHFEIRNEQSGPKFSELQEKLEKEKNSGWSRKLGGFLKGKKILLAGPFLALALAGGFFAVGAVNTEGLPASLTEVKNALYGSEKAAESELAVESQPFINEGLGASFSVKAEQGEGITHLARFAVTAYTEAEGIKLTPEQKVYAEDYLRKVEGDYPLVLGQEVAFNTEDIQNAVQKALALTEWQLQNLKQYTQNAQL